MTRYHFTKVSANVKTGPIPVSMSSRATCPDNCSLKGSGCYSESGNIAIHWRRLSNGFKLKDGTTFGVTAAKFLKLISQLPTDQLWRHNTAGDLTGANNTINAKFLDALVAANRGKRGFTYTHKPMTTVNQALVKKANANGFTINLSADSPAQADQLKALGVGPVVTILPETVRSNFKTDAGNLVVVCPATTHDGVNCANCALCAWKDRDVIVGFPAHGSFRKRIQPEMPAAFRILQ